MARDIQKIYSRMVDDMHRLEPTVDVLEACMSLNESAIRWIPLRYRIIALGFVKGFTLDELNAKLEQHGCPRLYSRNFWEATLIFAFLHGNSYDQWQQFQAQCAELYGRMEADSWFSGAKINYDELERYVLAGSEEQGDLLATQTHTRYLEHALMASEGGVEALKAFLSANLQSFSVVRERTRYYFCKYLYYYLNRRIENYFDACRKGRGVETALSEMLSLKVVTQLRRKQRMPEAEKRALIRESDISCGEIFDAFNYFFFGYVSTDWVQILMECYERIEDIPARQQQAIARVLRKDQPELGALPDIEAIRQGIRNLETQEDAAYSTEGSRGYQKNRSGEHALRKYIQGVLDIDRPVLICFLLFLASDAQMPEAHRLTVPRLNEILSRCGYPVLNLEDDFDWFVVEFLESRRPLDFLDEVIVGYARQHENSFLYRIYGNSVHNEGELLHVMARQDSEG